MEFNPYKDLIIPMAKHQETRKPIDIEDFNFPDFNLKKMLNPTFDPFRRIENMSDPEEVRPTLDENPEDEGPAIDTSNEVIPFRTKPEQAVGEDPSGIGAPVSTQGQNLTGGKIARSAGAPAPEVQSDHLPGGEGKVNSDGSVTDANGGVHPVGERGTNKTVDSKNTPARTPADTDPASQHNPDNIKSTKDKIMDAIKKGAALIPILLPLSLLLAGLIQGEIDCNQIDNKSHSITSAVSAATPDTSSWPSWLQGAGNAITQNKTKVDLTISPCVQFLSTDTVTIENSNAFDISDSPIQLIGPCKIRIDAGEDYRTSNAYSNAAILHVHTNCADRIGYAVGQDINSLLTPTLDVTGGLLSGLGGALPWGQIFIVLAIVVGIYMLIELIKVFKGS